MRGYANALCSWKEIVRAEGWWEWQKSRKRRARINTRAGCQTAWVSDFASKQLLRHCPNLRPVWIWSASIRAKDNLWDSNLDINWYNKHWNKASIADKSLGIVCYNAPFDKSKHNMIDRFWDDLEGEFTAVNQITGSHESSDFTPVG